MPNFDLRYLADTPEIIPTVAAWHHHQWHYLTGALTLPQRISRLNAHLRRDGRPLTIIAWHAGEPVGCASLVNSDRSSGNVSEAWLASVYVDPSFRQLGIGSSLVQTIEHIAKNQGFDTMHLYTEDKESFYHHLGWRTIASRLYRGYPMTVMQRQLGDVPTQPFAESSWTTHKAIVPSLLRLNT